MVELQRAVFYLLNINIYYIKDVIKTYNPNIMEWHHYIQDVYNVDILPVQFWKGYMEDTEILVGSETLTCA